MTKIKKFLWKVWIRLNPLTDAPIDYVADVSTAGKTVRNEDIAQDIKDEGSELSYETILDNINRADRRRRVRVQQGFTVLTQFVHVSPRVKGAWKNEAYNPDEHQITVNAHPSAELHEALAEIGVEVLGIKEDGGAYIAGVTDAKTGRTDGFLTPNGIITITGNKIKIDPTDASNVGIYFDLQGATTVLKVATIAENKPKRIVFLAPALAAGKTYTLRIVTQFTGGDPLKAPRTLVFKQPVKTQPTIVKQPKTQLVDAKQYN
jgi:hypothetical protein